MMANGVQPDLTFRIDSACVYTRHKGRMPRDVHELREWLREYSEFENKRLQSIANGYADHLKICNSTTNFRFFTYDGQPVQFRR